MVCVGLISICLGVLLHPQWHDRERLAYPLVSVVQEILRPGRSATHFDIEREGGKANRSRAFWIAFSLVMLLHTINGWSAWTEGLIPAIDLRLDFSALKQLTPSIAQVPETRFIYDPTIYLGIIALAYFLRSDVSLSVGLAPYLWVAFGGLAISNGILIGNDWRMPAEGSMLRTGSYLAMLLTILYFGRRYYLQLLAAAIGLTSSQSRLPSSAVWVARLLALPLVSAMVLLHVYAGMSLLVSVSAMLILLGILIVLARVHVETGVIFLIPGWSVLSVLVAVMGLEGLGIEAAFGLAILSGVLMPDPREPLLPLIANGLAINQRLSGVKIGRLGGAMAAMMLIGLVVAVVVTLTIQMNFGSTPHDAWPRISQPRLPFAKMLPRMAELEAEGTLAAATAVRSSFEQLSNMQPDLGHLSWLAAGFVLVFGCAAARLRWAWWPLHPVIFILWGTYAGAMFAFSFLLGSVLKKITITVGGASGYHRLKPAMAGVIAGELLAMLLWIVLGVLNYAITSTPPATFRIWPG
jgi:hypothetical protein